MAQSTSGMFANLFGLRPMLDMVNDPEFQRTAQNFLYYIADTHRRVCEIEDLLRSERGLTSTIPEQYRPFGTGRPGLAAGPHHNGAGLHAPEDGGHVTDVRGNGEDR